MQGPGTEADVHDTFSDGTYYISIGQDANLVAAITAVAAVVKASGGVVNYKEIREEQTLANAVSSAAEWFKGRKVLFLIDDLWPNELFRYE